MNSVEPKANEEIKRQRRNKVHSDYYFRQKQKKLLQAKAIAEIKFKEMKGEM